MMLIKRKVKPFFLLIGFLITLPANTLADDYKYFAGDFNGGGRACYGKLTIKHKTISWHTPFSICRTLPYEIIEKSQQGNEQRIVYFLKKRNKECFYQVISLTHKDITKPDMDWGVIGYQSFTDYTNNILHNTLGCGLVR